MKDEQIFKYHVIHPGWGASPVSAVIYKTNSQREAERFILEETEPFEHCIIAMTQEYYDKIKEAL